MSDPVSMKLDTVGFTRALKRAGAAVSGPVLTTAMRSACLIVQNAAKVKAPYRTGNLKRSIHTEIENPSTFTVLGTVGTNVEYARRIEYGFVGADSLGRVYHQGPKPYLRPALEENRANVKREFEAVIELSLLREGLL